MNCPICPNQTKPSHGRQVCPVCDWCEFCQGICRRFSSTGCIGPRGPAGPEDFEDQAVITIGIDNGISGSIALLSPLGQIIEWIPMPVQKVDGMNEVDVLKIDQFVLENNVRPIQSEVFIERPVGSKSAHAARSMAGSFHALRAYLELRNFKVHRITAHKWQKALLGKGDTKKLALSKARELWPDENWLRTPKCSKPHDGAVDAALIAYWGLKNMTKRI